MKKVVCQYCGKIAKYIDSKYVYKKSYGMIYHCDDCQAWVGVHKGTDIPLGVLANAELREWKKRAHFHFDVLWKSGLMKRGKAYKWLAKQLGKSIADTHIGMFNVGDCKRTVIKARQAMVAREVNQECTI